MIFVYVDRYNLYSILCASAGKICPESFLRKSKWRLYMNLNATNES